MIGRREFLKSFGAGVALFAGRCAAAQDAGASVRAEPCVVDMMRGRERYLIDLRSPEGLKIAAYLLRDVEYGNLIGTPEFDLLRLAAWAQAYMAAYGRYTVLNIHSGLRTREHNAHVEKAAISSLHIPRTGNRFSAMDVDPYGIDREYFGQLVATTKFGGVGWYATHIHLDCRAHPAYWRA